jgi:hypothetical protein
MIILDFDIYITFNFLRDIDRAIDVSKLKHHF